MKNKPKNKIAPAVKPLKSQEVAYRKQINKLGKALMVAVKKDVLEYLKSNQESYTLDGIGDQLGLIFGLLNARFSGNIAASFAMTTATNMVNSTAKSNRQKFGKSIARATGVDPTSVMASEGLEDFVKLQINTNIDLINNLSEDYLKQIKVIVNNGVASGARYSTIEKQILGKVGTANSKLANRIKTIATNEIQTINAQMSLRRSENLGIKQGIYRTSEDEVVRPCHKELNGFQYALNKGAWSVTCQKYIQPGITDINCRCTYSPVINPETI